MAKKKDGNLDFNRYEFADLASNYVQRGDFESADLALGLTQIDNDGRLLLDGSEYFSTERGIRDASNIYGQKYLEGLMSQRVSDLRGYFGPYIGGLNPEAEEKVTEIFDRYGDNTLGDVQGKFKESRDILENPEGLRRAISPYVDSDSLDEEVRNRTNSAREYIEENKDFISLFTKYKGARTRALEGRVDSEAINRFAQAA